MTGTFGDGRPARIAVGTVFGATGTLLAGLVAVMVAPDSGFADLAAAAVTRAVLVPSGAVAGALLGYHSGR